MLCGFAPNEMRPLEVAMLQQDYSQVQKLASQFIQQGLDVKQSYVVRYYLALSYSHLEKYAQAKALFRSLISKVKDVDLRDKIYLGLSETYYLNGQYEQAKKVIQDLLEKNPNSNFKSIIYFKLAKINLKLTHWEKAQVQLTKVIREFPKSMDVYEAKQLLEEKPYFGVQVGSFLGRDRAENLMNELQKNGEYAYIVETVDSQKRRFYRVRVGQLSVLHDAQQLKLKLSYKGYPAKIFP